MTESTNRNGERDAVAIVGCGLMGAAIARCLARGGHRVLAWNRTHERAQALAGDGITPVRDLAEMVRTAPLVIVCTTNYETSIAALEPVEDWTATTLVNLTSGIPEEAEQMERWATGKGAGYLDGVVNAYPRQIGLPDTILIYSGSPSVWSAYEQTLMELGGGSARLSENVGMANLVFGAFAGFYTAALGAYVEAATYTQENGVVAAATRALTTQYIEMLRDSTEEAGRRIESGDHETDQATIAIFLDGMQHTLPGMQAAGNPFRILTAARENLESAAAAGLGELDFCAQSKVIGGGRSHIRT